MCLPIAGRSGPVAHACCSYFDAAYPSSVGFQMTPLFGPLQAVETAYQYMFVNSGQICVAPSRLFVHEGIYDAFLERVVARAKQR